jgi:hypothetical protein
MIYYIDDTVKALMLPIEPTYTIEVPPVKDIATVSCLYFSRRRKTFIMAIGLASFSKRISHYRLRFIYHWYESGVSSPEDNLCQIK